ncbi:MAG TPA: hypothetical protein VHT26_18405 [Trebonia sp.]|nr:hypothetical protein [Trebonia sp.]
MSREQWRAPFVLRVKSVVAAAVGVTIAVVFFPRWFGIPVAVLLGAWGLGMAVLGGTVVVDRAAGLLVLRMGLISRRVRFTDVTAVLVDKAKVSVARVKGGEISLYAWRRGPLDALLGVPVVASDIGHAIASCVALAQAMPATEGATREERPARPGPTPARVRSRLSGTLLGGWGLVAILAALVVRVHWDNTALTVLGVIIALALGVSGLLSFLIGLWILLTGRAPQASQLM